MNRIDEGEPTAKSPHDGESSPAMPPPNAATAKTASNLSEELATIRLDSLTPPPNVSTAPRSEQSTAEFQGNIQPTISVPDSGRVSSLTPPPNVSTAPMVPRTPQFATGSMPPQTTPMAISTPVVASTSRTSTPTPMSASQHSSTPQSGPALEGITAWTKLKPLSAQGVLVKPLPSGVLPEGKADEPLFLGTEKVWYVGFVRHWVTFQSDTIEFYNSQRLKSALEEIKKYPIGPPRESKVSGDDGQEWLADYFQREVLEVVGGIYNRLLKTLAMQAAGIPESMSVARAAEVNMGNGEFEWERDLWFEVRAKAIDGDEQTRLIGHADYIAGRPGALSWAIREQLKNSWGSLRCVLGEIAQAMLMDHIEHAFVTSGDEILFLKMEIVERVKHVNRVSGGQEPQIEEVETFKEPWLYYSDPIKYTDILDEANGTVPVRLALLYFMHKTSIGSWQLPNDMGKAAMYVGTTKIGEKWKPPPLDMSLFRFDRSR